jgi:hypothetical protein
MSRAVVIKSIILEVPTNADGMVNSFDQEKFALVVENAIDNDSHFRFDAKKDDGAVLRFALVPPDEKTRVASVMLVASLIQNKSEHRSFADIKILDGSVSGQEILVAINKVLKNLYLIHSGSSADNQVYLDKLQSRLAGEKIEQGELINAISVLGETQEKMALEPLIKLLSSTNDLVLGNACLIALSRLAAPEAMPAIIDFVERKPPLIRRQGIIAARSIANKLAAEWLLVMAYGHEDPLVRKEAMDALWEVEEKLAKAQ